MKTNDNNNKNSTLPEHIESYLSGTRFNFKIPTDPDKKKLIYTFNNNVHDYMNFTIELVIGKKQDGKHVQYSLECIKKACS